jgi:hypothetical protein
MNLREKLNPEEQIYRLGYPTSHKTARNQHRVRCQECAGLYYVDTYTFCKVVSGLSGDASEIHFICNACEHEYAEASLRT